MADKPDGIISVESTKAIQALVSAYDDDEIVADTSAKEVNDISDSDGEDSVSPASQLANVKRSNLFPAENESDSLPPSAGRLPTVDSKGTHYELTL